jgi:excisionase family DNA binding protein
MTNNKSEAAEPIAVSPQEATRLLSLGMTTIYKLINEGRLESTVIGGRRLILYTSLKKLAGAT